MTIWQVVVVLLITIIVTTICIVIPGLRYVRCLEKTHAEEKLRLELREAQNQESSRDFMRGVAQQMGDAFQKVTDVLVKFSEGQVRHTEIMLRIEEILARITEQKE